MKAGSSCPLTLFLALLFITGGFLTGQDARTLPKSVDFGNVKEGTTVSSSFPVTNGSRAVLYLEFLPACDCVRTEPGELTLGPGDSVDVKISFDSTGYSGPVEKAVLVRSSDPGFNNGRIGITAQVTGGPAGLKSGEPCPTCKEIEHLEEMKRLAGLGKAGVIFAEVFYSAGCRECEKFLTEELPEIRESSRLPVVLKPYDIMDDAGYEVYLERTGKLGLEINSFPALILGGKAAEGVPAMRALLLEEIGETKGSPASGPETASENGNDEGNKGTGPAPAVGALSVLPVFTAGLIDGINPCAFSTIIFLISALTAYGRTRRQILLTGTVFALSVFATYYLVGLGAFTAIRTAAAFPLIAKIIRWALFATLLVFAALSVYDGLLARAGKIESIVLQLPGSMKKRIHKAVHGGMKSASLVAGTAVMGFLVSVFELACTGQVYLPTITWMVARGKTSAYGYLLLYNVAFILPLGAVFILAYTGTGSAALASFFRRRTAAVKFALAGVFALLGLLTILL